MKPPARKTQRAGPGARKVGFLARCVLCLRTCLLGDLGRAGEIAARYLLSGSGLFPVESNWRSRNGELDLIFVSGENELVFVEVKTSCGTLSEAWSHVDRAKSRHLRRTALDYLAAHRIAPDHPWRIDVVVLAGDPRTVRGPLWFQWVRGTI